MFNEGEKVSGKFYGVEFSGVIKNRWFNEANHRLVAYHVTLNQPINALGLDGRDDITVTVGVIDGRDGRCNTEINAA